MENVNSKWNIIVRVVYRNLSTYFINFDSNYLNKLLKKFSKVQKSVFLLVNLPTCL